MTEQSDKIKADEMPIKRWSLTFNEALEAEYQAWAATHLQRRRFFGLVAGVVLMLFLGLVDLLIFAESWRLPLILHSAVALPLFVLAALANYYKWQQKYMRYSEFVLPIVLLVVQFTLLVFVPTDGLTYATTIALQIGLVISYDIAVLAADFSRANGHVVFLLIIISRLISRGNLPFEWGVVLSIALLVVFLLSSFALYYRIYVERRHYYTIKGQSRFADKVGAAPKSDPVIKRVESPVNKMFYAVSDVIWFITTEGDVAYVSPSVKEFMGYEPEELIGKRAITLMPPEVYRDFEAKMTRLYRDKNIVQAVFDFRTKAGLIKSGETHARAYTDNQRGDGYVATTRPISEEKVKERATSERRLKDLTEENAGLKSDLHNLTEEVDTLTEKLTVVNRELASSGQIGQKTFITLLADLLASYRDTLLPTIEMQRVKLAQLVKKFDDKSMGKHDLTNYFGQSRGTVKQQRDALAFVDHCYRLYGATADERVVALKPHKIAALFEAAVLELKDAFADTDHVVNIDCADDVVVQSDAELFATLIKYLLLRSLTQSLSAIRRGAIDIKAFQFKQDIVIEYRDNGKGPAQSQFEQFFLQCLQKSGYAVDEDSSLMDYYVKQCLEGAISWHDEDDGAVTVISLPAAEQNEQATND